MTFTHNRERRQELSLPAEAAVYLHVFMGGSFCFSAVKLKLWESSSGPALPFDCDVCAHKQTVNRPAGKC